MAVDLTQSWTTARFAAFDFETTGTDTENDRIIEVGIVVFDNGQIVDRYQQLVDPQRDLPDIIVDVTGIKPEDLEGQPVFADVADRVMELLRDTLLLAYNHEFDTSVLSAELARIGKAEALSPCLDPFPFVYEHFREAGLTRNAKLTTISEHLGVTLDSAHRADHDAEAAGRVLLELPNHVVLPERTDEFLQVQRALLQAVTEKFNRFRRNRGDGRALNSAEILIELGAAYLYGDEADPVRALFSRIPDVRDIA
jgi:DNA polymerase III epsilon subunit family exonuclease